MAVFDGNMYRVYFFHINTGIFTLYNYPKLHYTIPAKS